MKNGDRTVSGSGARMLLQKIAEKVIYLFQIVHKNSKMVKEMIKNL
jgi:hypothetical protein